MAKRGQKRPRSAADNSARKEEPASDASPPKWYDAPPKRSLGMLALAILLLAVWLGFLAWLAFTAVFG